MFFPAFLFGRNVSGIVGDKFEETSGKGLAIRTSPSGVKVFIDGVERGLTPVNFNSMQAGQYNIRLSREGYKDRSFNVVLFDNSRLVVSIEMEEVRGFAVVSVHRAEGSPDSLPLNPQIYPGSAGEIIDAISAGNTIYISLPVGYRTIRVRAFGWEDASVTALIDEHTAAAVNINMTQAAFRIEKGSQSRRRFNPKNPNNLGAAEFHFEVSAPGSGTFTILDENGKAVHEERLDYFDDWPQSATWNGRDSKGEPLPEGLYAILIEASASPEFSQTPPETVSIRMEIEIDYTISIYPVSLSGGIPGLVFAPLPRVLPAGSFQIEGGIVFGSFHAPGKNVDEQRERFLSGLPFELGLRFSPVEKMEAAAVFNTNPQFDNSAGWGITGSLKFNILHGSTAVPLALATGASYAWAAENGEAPLSPGRGIGLYSPISLELTSITLVFSPGMFWHGPDTPVPLLLLSGGVLYRRDWLNAGLSVRSEFNFSETPLADNIRILTGAESRFYPPPSNLVFSFQAGVWTRGPHLGGYGGLGIGVVF